MERCIYAAGDIDLIVKTKSQAEILTQIEFAEYILGTELKPDIERYWQDRLSAYRLAYDIALWDDKAPVTEQEIELAELRAKNEYLRNKIIKRNEQSKITITPGAGITMPKIRIA